MPASTTQSEQSASIAEETVADSEPSAEIPSSGEVTMQAQPSSAGQPAQKALLASTDRTAPSPKTFLERVEAYISRLSTKNNFWHRVTSLIWLPFAYRSGIRVKKNEDPNTFAAVLPFWRFNRNWYNAMAGAALLGNSEIAGGMFVFKSCGGDYTVVCKHLEYKFLRPCLGPAMYRCHPREDVKALVASGGEFNITIDMDVVQLMVAPTDRERRVGKVTATFHVTPKVHHKRKRERASG
ncbi:MAG: hypothetical protein KF768_11980 [Phycisphaeraceae bacterium]|nr:hypothetical protein [Phycisphaeraceae bacterium]